MRTLMYLPTTHLISHPYLFLLKIPSSKHPFGLDFVLCGYPANPLEAEKKIVPQDEAFAEYPDSFHLPDIRKRATPVLPEQTINYDLSKINGLSDLDLISKPYSSILPYNPKAPEFKKWTPRQLGK